MLSNKAKVLAIVSRIPPQKVVYFGQISQLVGLPPRVVGWILSGLSVAECEIVPWYRVVAKDGFIASKIRGQRDSAKATTASRRLSFASQSGKYVQTLSNGSGIKTNLR